MEETDMVQTIPFAADDNPIPLPIANACPAHLMTPDDRQGLALQALG